MYRKKSLVKKMAVELSLVKRKSGGKKPGLFEKCEKSLVFYLFRWWYEDFLFIFPSPRNVLLYTQKDISYLSKDVKERVFYHGLSGLLLETLTA